jgi:hypothetical protein
MRPPMTTSLTRQPCDDVLPERSTARDTEREAPTLRA